MADKLDVPASRVRDQFFEMLKRLRKSYTTLEAVQGHMEEWLRAAQ